MKKNKEINTGNLHTLNKRMRIEGFLLYLPAIIVIFLVIFYPLVYAVRMSFTNYRPTVKVVKFVGLANYLKTLGDVKFWQAMGRSLIFTFGSLIPQICLGLAMASLLNHPLLKCRTLFRGLAITPWLIPTVAVAMIFKWMFNDLYGILNFMLIDMGIISETKAWMSDSFWAMVILILANVWRGTPLMITMFLAGMQGISADLYEAAEVDGANAWTRFTKITLPLLVPVIMVTGVLRFIWTFNFYDLPWVMTGGGPIEATTTTPIYAYKTAFSSYRLGEGSAITVILFFVLLIFAFIYFRAKKLQDRILK